MKKLKIKMVSLGVISSIIISSTPVLATTKPASENKVSTTIYSDTKTASTISGSADDITNAGGIIQYGDEGEAVKEVQTALYELGYLEITDINGYFGDETRAMVKSFQAIWRLGPLGPIKGKVDKRTWTVMKDALS